VVNDVKEKETLKGGKQSPAAINENYRGIMVAGRCLVSFSTAALAASWCSLVVG
jgi:hypothetical protein